MSNKLEIYQYQSISRFAEKSIIPIIYDNAEENKGVLNTGTLGTGTLFKFLNRYFLITAGHVIEQIMKISHEIIGIPINRNGKSEISTLGSSQILLLGDPKIREEYDFGLIEFCDEIYEKLMETYFFLTIDNLQFNIQSGKVFILGYPHSFDKIETKKRLLIGNQFKLESVLTSTDQSSDIPVDMNKHFLIDYPEISRPSSNGDNISINIKGISGCSIWSLNHDYEGLWCAKKSLKVIGIQTGYFKSSKLIKGTRWNHIIKSFRSVDKDIFNMLHHKYENEIQNEK